MTIILSLEQQNDTTEEVFVKDRPDAALHTKLDENKAKKKARFLEEKLIKNMKGTE